MSLFCQAIFHRSPFYSYLPLALLSTTGILAEGLDISGKTRKYDLHFIFTLVSLDLLTHLALIFAGFEKLVKSVDFNEDAILECNKFLQKLIFDLLILMK